MKQSINKVTGLQVGFTTEWVVLDNGEWRVLTVDETVQATALHEAEQYAEAVAHFDNVTTGFIEAKVQEYNKLNGLAFKDIDAFAKYAINTASNHYTIANQFIAYADNVWEAVRAYQATLTAIPTDAEFQLVLDGVTF